MKTFCNISPILREKDNERGGKKKARIRVNKENCEKKKKRNVKGTKNKHVGKNPDR